MTCGGFRRLLACQWSLSSALGSLELRRLHSNNFLRLFQHVSAHSWSPAPTWVRGSRGCAQEARAARLETTRHVTPLGTDTYQVTQIGFEHARHARISPLRSTRGRHHTRVLSRAQRSHLATLHHPLQPTMAVGDGQRAEHGGVIHHRRLSEIRPGVESLAVGALGCPF